MPGDSEPNTAQNVPEAGATETPSADNELARVLSSALAPFLGQMTQLNENISFLLNGKQDDLEEDGETTSGEDSVKHANMDAELSEILAKNTIANTADPKMGDALLKRTRSGFNRERKNFPANS